MTENELGKPRAFNIDHYAESIHQMILADEVSIALEMFEKIPAYYRENKPAKLIEMKKKLLSRLFDTKAYIDCEEPADKEALKKPLPDHLRYPRFDILAQEIKKINDSGETPWIYEVGPGPFTCAIWMEDQGLKFNYKAHTLSQKMEHTAKNIYFQDSYKDLPKANQKTMFVANEVIEHMQDDAELAHIFHRSKIDFDYVFVSTPKYTFAGGLESWEDNHLGHLRTYSPLEFLRYMQKHFPQYQLTYYEFHCMLFVGRKING